MIERTTLYNGCKHYKRLCKIIAPCCKKSYHCQVCHDENEKHKVKNDLIKEIICNLCNSKQKISNSCINCKIMFGLYFCKQCVLWCNNNTDIFHCKVCKFCRVGKENLYYHCETCNACIESRLKNIHKHVENTLKSDCPICAEYLFTSRKDSILLRCGHSMHTECYSFYTERSMQCPICMKSMGTMEAYNRRVEKMIKCIEEINRKKGSWTCEVSCYDCGCDSNTNYKYLFNRCPTCESYNTRLNQINKSFTSGDCIQLKR